MTVICEFSVLNGAVSETYSVERHSNGDVFLHNVLDDDQGAPVDTMHIDPQAYYRLGLAFIQLAAMPFRADAHAPADNPVSFRKIVPGAARSVRIEGVV
jgi:hypothetical protein